jgi:membrane protein
VAAESTYQRARSAVGSPAVLLRWIGVIGRLAIETFRVCMRYRVTGLAAEAGFFALLSLPPLVLGLVASAGYLGHRVGSDVLTDLRDRVAGLAGAFVTPVVVDNVIIPTFNEVSANGRLDILSIGFVLSLWSGSRALNVYVDTVSIMYGLGGRRGIVRTRILSFSLYVSALILGVVLLPLMLVGPGLLSDVLHEWFRALPALSWLSLLYWPVVCLLSVAGLTTLYHLATPVRKPWRWDLAGATLALLIWLGASIVLRLVLTASVGGASIYGPLAAPIVILIWSYFLALAVLIGAALNAAVSGRLVKLAAGREREAPPPGRSWSSGGSSTSTDDDPPKDH